jgi:Spy/CpxP family protein refolding chaperone
MTKARQVLLLVMVLYSVVGVLAGVALDRYLLRPHHSPRPWPGLMEAGPDAPPGRFGTDSARRQGFEAMRKRIVERMSGQLDLSTGQRQQLDSILEKQGAAFEAIRHETEPRLRSLVDSTMTAVNQILNPDQQAKWQTLRQRMESPGGREKQPM